MTGIEALMAGIVTVLLILTPAGVILLRPVVKKLADYLEAAAAEKRGGGASRDDLAEIRAALERLETRVDHTQDRLESRLSLSEDRLDFQEKLLSERAEGRAVRTE
jgi:hypothetical protein